MAYYVDVLHARIILNADDLYDGNWIFRLINAGVHTSNITQCLSESIKSKIMNWPATSLDLNILQNV